MQKLSVALLCTLAAVPSESKIFRLLCFSAEKPIVLPTHKKRSSEVNSLGARSSTPLPGSWRSEECCLKSAYSVHKSRCVCFICSLLISAVNIHVCANILQVSHVLLMGFRVIYEHLYVELSLM
jgi:hypothetical protein